MFDEVWRRYHLWDLDRKIRKHGWTGIYLAGDAEEASTAYSIGFEDSLGAPEVVTFGADQTWGNGLFWTAYKAIKSGELTIADGATWNLDLGPNARLGWRWVHPSQIRPRYFGFAILRAARSRPSGAPVKAWQLVFGDRSGHLPWEAEFDLDYRPLQPALWEPYVGSAEDD